MTMAKKLPILNPSIHTFEVCGKYNDYKSKCILFAAIRKMVSEKKYYQVFYDALPENCYIYKRAGGGLTITLTEYPNYGINYIKLSGVNLARIAGEPSRLTLTDLSPDRLAEEERLFQEELEQLGILEIEDQVEWKLRRLDVTQDFYVKSDPSLMVKILRYAGKVRPYGKGQEEHYDLHNEKRSCKFKKTDYDIALYDKHYQLLNCQKKGYFIQPEDLEQSKNLVRYEIQLKRPYLKRFEDVKFYDQQLKFKDHMLFFYFEEISDIIPSILGHRALEMFGENAWYNTSSALKATEQSELDSETKALLKRYIEELDWSEAEIPMGFSVREWQRIEKALNDLKINEVIIPDHVLNERQYVRFPCTALWTRVQDMDERDIEIML